MSIDDQLQTLESTVRWLYREFHFAEVDFLLGRGAERQEALRRMQELHGRLISVRRDWERTTEGTI